MIQCPDFNELGNSLENLVFYWKSFIVHFYQTFVNIRNNMVERCLNLTNIFASSLKPGLNLNIPVAFMWLLYVIIALSHAFIQILDYLTHSFKSYIPFDDYFLWGIDHGSSLNLRDVSLYWFYFNY